MTVSTPKGRVHQLACEAIGIIPENEDELTRLGRAEFKRIQKAISQAVNEALNEAAKQCDVDWPQGFPVQAIEYRAAEVLKNRILKLKAAYGKGE